MIEVKNLTKCYGNFKAVDTLSFTVKEGEIYGFLGPNGAGKSTTMNIICGCLSASSGNVLVDGHDIFENAKEAKACIGYLPEIPPLYMEQTPYEYLRFVCEAKGVLKENIDEQITKVMKETQIEDVANKLIRYLSKGYKQRVGIAQALINDPKVIVLDEPTVGLDPKQIIEIRELIKSLGKKHTVILSSHILSEVQEICETIMIISNGKLVACDTPEQLKKQFSATLSVEIVTEASYMEIDEILNEFNNVISYEVEEIEEDFRKIIISFENAEEKKTLKNIFFLFAKKEKAILQMVPVKASLEDVFIELTEHMEEVYETNI